MSAVTSVGGIASVAPAAQTGLIADLQWYEQYTSGALNRKAYGIFVPGVYRGFSVTPGDGLNVVISPESSGPGVACINVNNYQITVQLLTAQSVALTAGKLNIVILEAFYEIGLKTKQVDVDSTQDAARFRVVNAESAIPPNAIEIARIPVYGGARSVSADQINTTQRKQYQIAFESTDDINDTRETRLLTVEAGKSFLPLVGGTVSGGLILASTLDVEAEASFANTLSVTGAATLSGKLNVVGITTLSNNLNVNGASTLTGTLSVTGATNIQGALTVANSAAVTGSLAIGGNLAATGYGAFTASGMALRVAPAAANKLYYLRGQKFDGTAHWYLGQGSDSTDTVTLRNHLTNSYIDLDTNKLTLGAANIAANGALTVTGDLRASAGFFTAGTAVFGYRSVYTRDNGAPYQTFRRQDVQRAPGADTEIGRVVFGYGDSGLDNYATAGLLSYMRGDALVSGSGKLTLVANNGGGATGASLSVNGTGAVDITGDLRLNDSLILSKYFQTTLGIDIGYRSTTAQQQGLNFFSAGNTTLTGSLFVSGPTMSSSVMNVTASLINLNGATAVGGDFTALGNINTYGTMHTNYGIDIGYQNRVAQAQQIAFYTGGNTTLTGAVSVFGSTVDSSTMTLTASSVAVTGNSTIRKDLQVNGTSAFLGLAAFDGPINTRWGLALGYRDTKAETQQLVFYTAGSNQVWTGLIEVAGTTLANSNMNLNAGNVNVTASAGKINLYGPVSTSSSITSQGEIIVNVNGNNLRLNNGTQSVLHRTTPSYYYILTTQAGDPLGSYNSLRPITIDLNSGLTMLGHGARIDGNLEARASATVAGTLSVSGDTALARNLVVSGSVTSLGEIITTASNGLRLAQDNYSIFLRNDGSSFWILLTDQGNKYGWYNNLRPFAINLSDGSVGMGHTVSVGGNLYMNGGDLHFNSAGSIYMNGGDTIFNRDGNVHGAAWGGWLSNWAAPRNTAALGLNGWHRDASTGLIRQWGQAPGGADDSLYTVNLPIPFPTAFVTLTVTPGYGAAVLDKHSLAAHGAIMNNSQFRYGVSDPAGDAVTAGLVYWEATGW